MNCFDFHFPVLKLAVLQGFWRYDLADVLFKRPVVQCDFHGCHQLVFYVVGLVQNQKGTFAEMLYIVQLCNSIVIVHKCDWRVYCVCLLVPVMAVAR